MMSGESESNAIESITRLGRTEFGRRGLIAGGAAVATMAGLEFAGRGAPAFGVGATGSQPAFFGDTFKRADGALGNGWASINGDWRIQGNRMVCPGGVQGAVVIQSGVPLGDHYAFEGSFRTVGSGTRWNGVALNVVEVGDGLYDYFIFRIRQDGAYQFLSVKANQVVTPSIGAGTVSFARGQDHWIEVEATPAEGRYRVKLAASNWTAKLDREFIVPEGRRLTGGHAGFYAADGEISVGWDESTGVEDIYSAALWVPLALPAAQPAVPGPEDQPWSVASVSSPGTTWGVHRVGQSLLTNGDDQYVAYYDAERVMTIAHRSISGGSWTLKSLPSVTGWDSHNSITMAIDNSGHLHVSGNMHIVPLIYFRTTVAGDISTLQQVATMVNSSVERQVTYPQFLRDGDGRLVYRYRDGSSSAGIWYFNVYDEQTQTWSAFLSQPLFDGEGTVNAYFGGPELGPDGMFHMSWVWRVSRSAHTNATVGYARSADMKNWETSGGAPVSLPIRFGDGDIVDPTPINGGLLNGRVFVSFDQKQRLLITYLKYDEAGNSAIYIARRERDRRVPPPRGGRGPVSEPHWKYAKVTDCVGRYYIRGGGSLGDPPRLSGARAVGEDRLRVDYSYGGENRVVEVHFETLKRMSESTAFALLPPEINQPQSTFPGMVVTTAGDLGGSTPTSRNVLAWESLTGNRDRAVAKPWPAAEPIRVYGLTR